MNLEEDIEEFFDTAGDFIDATKLVINIRKPQTFEQLKQQIIIWKITSERLEKENQELKERLKKYE